MKGVLARISRLFGLLGEHSIPPGKHSVSCHSVVTQCHCQQDTFLATHKADWASSYGTEPTGSLSHRQSAWDKPGIAVIRS